VSRRNFGIPINVDPAQRPLIKQLVLFVSSDEGKNWRQEAVASPDQRLFTFNAPTDGVYWFSVCVTDLKGNQEPASPYQVEPSQKVLVDTVKPEIKGLTADRQGDDVTVNWEVQEEHPNPAHFTLSYFTGDPASVPKAAEGNWSTVVGTKDLPKGEAKFKVSGTSPVTVRLEMSDMAGNRAQKDVLVSVSATSLTALTPPPPPPVATALVPPPTGSAVPVGSTVAAVAGATPDRAPATTGQPQPFPAVGRDPVPPTAYGAGPQVPYPAVTAAPGAGPREIATAGGAPDLVPVSGTMPSAAPPLPSPLPLPRVVVVNDRQINLEYDVRCGPSGVGRVELWTTKDEGRTWEFLTDDPDLRSPITASLPSEGIYGLRIVVHSGAGLTKGPPQAGDLPEMRVQVDTTAPHVRLFEPRPDSGRRDTLVVSWEARDQNLAPRPVMLEYAEGPEGPWQPIAVDMPGIGSFSWQLPPKVKHRVHLRATATDTAGNRTIAETREPVLIDLNKPEAQLISLVPAPRRQ